HGQRGTSMACGPGGRGGGDCGHVARGRGFVGEEFSEAAAHRSRFSPRESADDAHGTDASEISGFSEAYRFRRSGFGASEALAGSGFGRNVDKYLNGPDHTRFTLRGRRTSANESCGSANYSAPPGERRVSSDFGRDAGGRPLARRA